jgi:serine/threonine protein kinase/formylglycine-generating enzyme required for sulfatase activity
MANVPSDDLLFGLLALQMHFIEREDLRAALLAWNADRNTTLEQFLLDQKLLDAAEHAILVSLRAQLPRSEAAPSSEPSHAAAPVATSDPFATCLPVRDEACSSSLRFQVLRPHARGGLGEIFLATDQELGREVALKQLQDRHADHPESRATFLLEAEITGQLEHPGIVPVYGLGQYADGRPFYAMRFIRGESLEGHIQRFHESGGLGVEGRERSVEFRQLLHRFIAVCDAIEYAHSRGVIHRDLKPANVMLGKYGETLVVDWGLARLIDTKAKDSASEEQPLRPSAAGKVADSVASALAGTPPYMSPEQAAGRLNLLGPASDIYALGAVLYSLLTGQAPVSGPDLGVIFQKVQQGDFPRPRKLNRHIPTALEAICLKAMARRPEDRYASAQALAADVEHWLADEETTAHVEPWFARTARWARRHPSIVAAVSALLLTSVIGLSVSTLLVGREQQKTEEQRREAVVALQREEEARKERVFAQIQALLDANPHAVPELLTALRPFHDTAVPRLRELWDQEQHTGDRLKLTRIGLGLLAADAPRVKERLFGFMLETDDPDELLLLRNALRPYRAELVPALWQKVNAVKTSPQERFRALVVLVGFDQSVDERWGKWGDAVIERLLLTDPLHFGSWMSALRPAREALLAPLGRVFRKGSLGKRRVAAMVLADYARDRPDVLAELIADADEQQYATLWPCLPPLRERVIALLCQEVQKPMPPEAEVAARDELARRQAQAAVALLQLGHEEAVWPLLCHSPDPSRRTYFIHRLAPLGTNPQLLLHRLETETNVSARRALVLCLGELDSHLPPDDRQRLQARLLDYYRTDPDPGVHSASDWLLRRWGQADRLRQLDAGLAGEVKSSRDWFVNSQRQTFAVMRQPQGFRMGSPPFEPGRVAAHEAARQVKIPHAFALATRQVTVAQFLAFRKGHPYREEYSPGPDGPMIDVSWYDAAAYCNWLSESDGLPKEQWCYPEKFGPGIKLPKDYLSRIGYRLPTEAEWEYAARAGAVTSRFFGESEEMLGAYAWYAKTTGSDGTRPVGQLKPNDWGLFDVYGNAAVWCQTRWEERSSDAGDADLTVMEEQQRVYRGGGFFYRGANLRSAYRIGNLPTYRNYHLGFRPARTIR